MKIKNQEQEVMDLDVIETAELTEEEIIKELKKENPLIFKNIIEGQSFIWKPMSRKIHREVIQVGKDLEAKEAQIAREEAIVRSCVLYPSADMVETYIENKAGFAIVLSDEIFAKSGFDISETEAL